MNTPTPARARVMKDPFLTLGVLKDPFLTLGVSKDPFVTGGVLKGSFSTGGGASCGDGVLHRAGCGVQREELS
jgi:hypothetical protein